MPRAAHPSVALGERDERKIDDETGEIVEVGVEVTRIARGMLVVLMPDLTRRPTGHRGHEHAIKIDEPELSMLDDDISVLQIAVRHAGRAQRSEQTHPLVRQM